MRQQLKSIEQELAKSEAQKRDAETALADPALYGQQKSDRIAKLQRDVAQCATKIERLESEWLRRRANWNLPVRIEPAAQAS